jgi:hypothetical protein
MRTKTITVKAADLPVPLERTERRRNPQTGRDDTMVYPDEPRTVPLTAYVRRRLRSGELIEATAPTRAAKPASVKKEA